MSKETVNNSKEDKGQTNIKKTGAWYSPVLMALPIMCLFVVGPLEIYSSNSEDFLFSLKDFFPQLVGIGLLIWLLASVILLFLPRKVRSICNMLLFYIGLMFYVQNNFLNVKLSENDGAPMRWDQLKAVTTRNTIIWAIAFVIVIVGFILLKDKFQKIAAGLSACICLILFASVVTMLITAIQIDREKGGQAYTLNGADQFKVSKNDNVIFFVVDSYGSAQLDYGLENDPDLLNPLHDFTYYDNTDSHYYGTQPSMTNMLTCIGPMDDYDSFETSQEYLNKAWTNSNTVDLYKKIHENGYKLNLYSGGGQAVYGREANLYGKVDNMVPTRRTIQEKLVMIRVEKMSIYKFMPYAVKPRFEVPNYLFGFVCTYDVPAEESGNTLFMSAMQEKGLDFVDEDTDGGLIIVQHIDGTHLPTQLGADGTYVDESDLVTTQQGLIYIINDYLQRMKDLGVYDDATIIITADHARWAAFTQDMNDPGDDPQPILFIKKAGETHDKYQVNHTPIYNDDIMPTILDTIGLEKDQYSKYGLSIFDIDGSNGEALKERERTFYMKVSDSSLPKVPGSSVNGWYGYTYTGDREDLLEKISQGPDVVLKYK